MERVWLKSYPAGVPAEIDPTAFRSLGEFFAASVARFRDRTAFISMGKAISYGELDQKSRAFGSYLQNVVRLPRGARVALMLPNLLQYPIAMFGALRAGYVVVNCNPLYSPRELKHQLADSGAEAIVVLENFAGVLEKALGGTAVRSVVITGAGDQLGGARGRIVNLVLRHVRRAIPAYRLEQAGALQSRARAWKSAGVHGSAGRAGGRRVPAIYRRDDRRAEGGDADPSQPDRQSSAGARLDRRCDQPRGRNVPGGAAALPCVRPSGELLRPGDDRRVQSPDRQSARHPGPREGAAKDAVHGHCRRQHPLQRAAQQPGFRPPRFLAPASGDRRRHGGAARGRRAVEIADRQAADRSLRTDRDLSRRGRQSAHHRGLHRRDRPAAAFDRDRHSRRRPAATSTSARPANCASRARRSWPATGTWPTRPPR